MSINGRFVRAAAVHPAAGIVHTRWGVAADLPQMVAIEGQSFTSGTWGEAGFRLALKHREIIAMVAERGDREILGYMVYRLHKEHLELLNLAVRPDVRRQGVGTLLLDKLTWKLESHQRRWLDALVYERNLAAQIFLRAQGFRAVEILSAGDLPGATGDLYLMRYIAGRSAA